MANKGLELQQTKGMFQVRGIVTGTSKEKFFETKQTKTGKPMRKLNFGVETNKDSITYITLDGFERENVYFYKRAENKGEKGTTKAVPWAQRFDFDEEGFNLIGVRIGLEKTVAEDGREVNDNKTLTEYDACDYISMSLEDGQSVFIKGDIDYSSFNGEDGLRRMVKFVPNQISLCRNPIDFDAEDFEELSDFQQTIVFMDIVPDKDKDGQNRGIVQAKIINYNSVEDAEYIVYDNSLYNTFKKNLKPYTAIKVWGKINNKIEKDEVTETDVWGEENTFDRVRPNFIRELVITGADPNTIDTEIYTQEIIENAIAAKKEFGEVDNWGNNSSLDESDDDTWD